MVSGFSIQTKMVTRIEEEKGAADYTEDGTLDLKGRPVLRSKSGRWKACSFIVGIYYY